MARKIEAAKGLPHGWMDTMRFDDPDKAMEAIEIMQILGSISEEDKQALLKHARLLQKNQPPGPNNPTGFAPVPAPPKEEAAWHAMRSFAEATLALLAAVAAIVGVVAFWGNSATSTLVAVIAWLQFTVAIAGLGIMAAIDRLAKPPEVAEREPRAPIVRTARDERPVAPKPINTMPQPRNVMPPPKP